MMASPPPSHPRPSPGLDSLITASPELIGSVRDTPSSFGGEFQSVNGTASRHASVEHDGAGAALGYFDSLPALPQRFGEQQAALARAMSKMSPYSRPVYSHVRQHSDASSSSSGPDTAHPAVMAELEAQPYVAELPSSPAGVVFPVDERHMSSASSGIWPFGRPPLAHRRERSDGRSAARLDVVNEELIHGYHGPTDRVVGQTAVDRWEMPAE